MNLTAIYRCDGRNFKTVNGLARYLTRKHEADGITTVRADRTVDVTRRREFGHVVVAVYRASDPKALPVVFTQAEGGAS